MYVCTYVGMSVCIRYIASIVLHAIGSQSESICQVKSVTRIRMSVVNARQSVMAMFVCYGQHECCVASQESSSIWLIVATYQTRNLIKLGMQTTSNCRQNKHLIRVCMLDGHTRGISQTA